MSAPPDDIRVLHVDDEPDFADLTAEFLEREDDRLVVDTATSPDEGLRHLAEDGIDCIVSDFEMPDRTGIDFLESVRENAPDLPFILFTGKGSEEVASEAISAGVSDYLQKEGGTDQYAVLANRITNLVSQYRAIARVEEYAREREESERYRQRLLETIADPGLSEAETIDALLALGCERFGVENGHLVAIDEQAGRHQVTRTQGSDVIREGITDLSETYCRRTLDADGMLDIAHASEHGWADDPAFEAFGLECYIGGTIGTTDELYGTLCFVDREPREPFTHNEKAFFDLLVRWFSQTMERNRHLREAERIFQHTQDALFLIDVTGEETFTIQNVNRAWEDLTGLSLEDVRGATPREVVGADQGDDVAVHYRDCIERGESIEYDEQLSFDGTTRYWHTRLAPVFEGDTVVQLVGATRDITERRRQAQHLREEQQFVQSIFDALPDPLYAFDTEGRPLRWNEQLEAVTGYDAEEIEGMYVTEFTPADEIEHIAAEFQQIVEDGRTVTVESAFETKDGDRIPYEFTGGPLEDADGNIRGATGVGRELTKRKERERRLRALNRTAQRIMTAETREEVAEYGVEAASEILNLAATAVYLYDADQSALVPIAVTEAGYDLVGEPPTFTAGDSIPWRVYDTGEQVVRDAVEDTPDAGAVQSGLFLPIGDRGVVMAGSAEPAAFDEQDRLLGEILAGTIATGFDQVDRTETLRERERELTRQNERLTEFTSVVSHDLRNPLNVVSGRLELARDECESSHFDPIETALDRMERIIDDLLWLAREGRDIGELESVALTDAMQTAWTTTGADHSDATLEFVDQNRLGSVQADDDRLCQLLENLFRNTIEHAGPAVTVTVGPLEDGFYVEDDGPGIPPGAREDVFDAGYTTSTEGTGFGLRIVKQVAEAHGWAIEVTEGSTGGARFEITSVGTDPIT